MKALTTAGLTKLIQLIKSSFISVDDTVETTTVTLADVATSGSYNDLTNKPTIPSEVTESTVSGWGFTKNTGTVTSVNNVQPVNGNVTLPSPEYTAGMGLGLLENEFKVIQNDTVAKNFASIGNGSLDGNYNYTGASKSYLLLPNVIQLNTANSWEFQTTYKYNGGGSRPTIIGYYNNLDCKTPAIFYDGNAGIRLLVSTNGSSWNILTNGFIPVTNTTYNIKAGFTGSEYYLEYKTENETSWTRLSVQNSTKCYCNEKFILMNLGWNYSNYYSAGTIDLKSTKIIVNNSVEWEAVTTTSSSGFVAKATNLLYGLVKPDNSSITVNDGIISSHITSNDVTTALGYTPQAQLVSGTNIKTINNNSILGSGNLTLDGLPSQTGQSGKFLTTNGTTASWATLTAPAWGDITGTLSSQTDLKNALDDKVEYAMVITDYTA